MYRKKWGSQQIHDGLKVRNKIRALVGSVIILFFLGTIGYSFTKDISFFDGFMGTIETVTFLHDHEESIGPKTVQLLLLLFGSFVIWFALWTTLDLVLEGELNDYFTGVNLMNQVKELKNHWIICGAGRVGTHVAELVLAKNEQYIIIDRDPSIATAQMKKGFLVVDGDALEEETLVACGIKDAKGFVAVLPETEKNVLAILTARECNPSLKIYARAHRKEYIKKLKKAGADYVFLPEYTCAEEIVKKMGDGAKKEEKKG